MGNNNLNWIANFIWGIADDVLRDLYVRGKYRDVILPADVPFITSEKFARLGQGKLRNGDLVVTVRGTIGNCALFSYSPYPTAFINAQMMILRPDRSKIAPEYLLCLAISRYWQDQLAFRAYGSAQKQLSNQILSSQLLPVPPEKEQQFILGSLWPRIGAVDRAIALAQREIDLFSEYRTRLIADVVTGKLDVREAAARLPEGEAEWEDESPEEGENTPGWMSRKAAPTKSSKRANFSFTFFHYIVTVII